MPDEQPITILLIEDEPAHAEIVRRNFESIGIANMLQHVSDGEAALDFGEVGMIVLLSPLRYLKRGIVTVTKLSIKEATEADEKTKSGICLWHTPPCPK